MAALMWARRRASTEGVLRVAEALAPVAAPDVVRHCVRIAERMAAAQTPAERERVRRRAAALEAWLVSPSASPP